MSAYPWQSVGHDASITCERSLDDPDQVTITIAVGDHAEARITMWHDTFVAMVTPCVEAPHCATCSGPVRQTVGMVCPECGTDYAPRPEDVAGTLRMNRTTTAARIDAGLDDL